MPACTTCHRPDLLGNAAIGAPSIAGKPAAYIIARLAHYAGPQGHNPMMKQIAMGLAPDEKRAVASYLATLKPVHRENSR
ncbi:c-type cytochrome [Novosphingobium sp.]|uniref:c-type cytochrome n=1 Tax=Novosphingobium sp. TaxID=1874826 RepID=UPI003D6C7358